MVEQLRPIVVVVGLIVGQAVLLCSGAVERRALPQGTAVGSGNQTRRLTPSERKACSMLGLKCCIPCRQRHAIRAGWSLLTHNFRP